MRNPWLLVLWGVLLGASPFIGQFSRLQKAEKAQARLEAIRASIKDGAYPRPINCAPYIGQPWAGHVLLKDWPEGEPVPEVCHLKPEVERLGLVPKDQI